MSGELATVAPKVAKLIPRLASDHDGEVVATVRAIRRTLAGAGLDLHALAANIAAPAAQAEAHRSEDELEPDWRDIITRLLRRADDLSDKELAFINSMARWLRAGSVPTQKQGDWLLRIADRVFGE